MTADLNIVLNEALPRWAALTGTKLGATSFKLYPFSDSSFNEYDLSRYIKDLNKTRTLDLSGTTTILMLRGLFTAYVSELHFSSKELLTDPTAADAQLAELRSFRALLHQEICDEAVEEFQETLRAATVHYGYDAGRLDKLFTDELQLGCLRRDAFLSLQTLDAHQFSQGPRGASDSLHYNPKVYEFWNINSFLAALRHQRVAGITMALIRDLADVYRSYFALGLRNGETITLLTDFQEGPHPDFYQMTRRPDRRLDDRAAQHWFPYQFLQQLGDDAEELSFPRESALVPLNTEAVPIGELSALEPEQFVWTALLFNLIARRFGQEDHRIDELSYTGEMVIEPHALIEESSALVKANHYQPLVLPAVTLETATQEAADTEESVGHNAWMEERYAKRVPPIVFNVVGRHAALGAAKKVVKRLPPPPDCDNHPEIPWGAEAREEKLVLRGLDPTMFGTREQIVKNRAWTARVNLMQGVQRLAETDYAKNRNRIWEWFRKHVEKNAETILDAVAHGEFVAPCAFWRSRYHEEGEKRTPFPAHDSMVWVERDILAQYAGRNLSYAFPGLYGTSRGVTLGTFDKYNLKSKCYIRPAVGASVFTTFTPNNPKAVALLAGVDVSKLPWPLQHWYSDEPYTGNSILSRVDPVDWILDNPWRRLRFTVTVALCKRAFKARRKALGLDPNIKVPTRQEPEY